MTGIERINETKDKYIDELLQKANVVGVAVGYKEKAGQRMEVPSLVILVRKKIPRSRLKARDLIPPEIDGIATDVKEVGDIRPL